MTCPECGQAPIHARQRCHACYCRHYRDGTHIDLPRGNRHRDDTLHDYRLLAREGHTTEQIAARLGVKPASLTRTLRRARRAATGTEIAA